MEQARKAVATGAKEIVLTGVNIGDFGTANGETLLELVKQLDALEGVERFRISSIEPNLLTDEIYRICSYFQEVHAAFSYPAPKRQR